MKSRQKIKENRRLKAECIRMGIQPTDKPWLNSEGYRDPTAYAAIRNIERRERATVR